MFRPANRWRRVSTKDIEGYVPWNAPVEALEMVSQQIVFELVETACEGTVEAMVPSIKVKGVDGDGRWNGGDINVNGTTSGGSIDLLRVTAALLAGESQCMHYS